MADQYTANGEERVVNVSVSFVANPQTTKLMQPTDRSLDDPSINAKPTAVICVASSDVRIDSDFLQPVAMRVRVVCAVGVQFIKAITRRAAFALDRRYIVDQLKQLRHIMSVGGGGLGNNRDAVGVGQQMVFRAWFSAVYRAGTCAFAPPTARTVALSTTHRLKSIWSAPRSLSRRMRWIIRHTPALFQSRSRRQQVMPEPQPISWGNISQGMPDLSTKRIPVNAVHETPHRSHTKVSLHRFFTSCPQSGPFPRAPG